MNDEFERAVELIKAATTLTDDFASEEGLKDLLFHYTDATGLRGIITDKALWATNFQFLNDRSEYIYGQNVVFENLSGQKDACTDILRELWPSVADVAIDKVPHYVASTCSEGDSLSQWRGYARLHDGYAIAFRRERLSRPNLRVLSVIYSRPDQDKYVKRILDAALAGFTAVDTEKKGALLKQALLSLHFAIYSMKDPSFAGEKEWRLVAFREPNTERFRVVGGEIVPYIEIPLNPGDIDHIVQGPGRYREASGAAIARFASSHGFEGIMLKPSQVPIG